MKTETREIYTCDYCGKIYKLKRYAIAHEPKCKKNPVNHHRCYDYCEHLCKKKVTWFWDSYDGSHESQREILYCNAKKEGVYPFYINGLESDDIMDNDTNEPIENNVMPTECKHYQPPLGLSECDI